MIKAAMVGLGWWGRTIVESVQGSSDIIQFVAGATRTKSPEVTAFADAQKLKLADSFEALLGDKSIDAIVLATPHSMHSPQVIAAAQAGKHVFCEKPFALHKADADAAVAATKKAGVTLGLGYNRRFHPEMTSRRDKIKSGEIGTVLHFEATMTFPNALFLAADAWRADREETPCGGLTPMGVHAIDGMIDLCGPGFSFQVFGSNGWVRLEGMTHVAGAPSEERRTRLFGTCRFQPAKGPVETWEAERLDVTRAALEAFAVAAEGGAPYPIGLDDMVHGASVTEAVVRSAASGAVERVA